MQSLDPAADMLTAGRVTVLDVSVANDVVKNLATADLLRKSFAYKVLKADAPPTLVVIEEAHSFISKEKIQTMQATLQMLRNVTRRGRKRWFAAAFVSQQPGHLPAEIFELCNTRMVHTLRSMRNLETLMATTSDITGDLWARCPPPRDRVAISQLPATAPPSRRHHPPGGQSAEVRPVIQSPLRERTPNLVPDLGSGTHHREHLVPVFSANRRFAVVGSLRDVGNQKEKSFPTSGRDTPRISFPTSGRERTTGNLWFPSFPRSGGSRWWVPDETSGTRRNGFDLGSGTRDIFLAAFFPLL